MRLKKLYKTIKKCLNNDISDKSEFILRNDILVTIRGGIVTVQYMNKEYILNKKYRRKLAKKLYAI